MKLDRRAFIKFLVGGGVGTALTPLPWKMIDDSSIWTQNWPWVPRVIRYPEIEYGRTVCTLCDGGCGVEVRLVNGRNTIKVEGSPSAPVNQGKVCPIGAAGPQYQYNLARFQGPLEQNGARGSGVWGRMSWSSGLKKVGARLAELREKGQAHTVVMITGRAPSPTRDLAAMFMKAYGSPNLVYMPTLRDSKSFAQALQFGPEAEIGYDLENSKYILSFGSGIIEGWGGPVNSIRAYSSWSSDKDVKFVQVDNRASLTASRADEWTAVVPGTEAALALGLASVLVKENLYKSDYVSSNGEGFDEFKAMLQKDYTPEKVAEITGVKPGRIEAMAKELAGAERPVVVAGKGRGALTTPVYELMSVMALNALLGAINQPGGVIVRKSLPLSEPPEMELDETAQRGLEAPRLDLAGSPRYPLSPPSLLGNLVESVSSGRLYPINVLIVDRADPCFSGPYAAEFRSLLEKIPMVVSFSSLADDTSYLADVVLPETSNFEGPAEAANPDFLPYPLFGAADGVVSETPFDSKPAADIIIGLAKAVGGSVKKALPYKNSRDMLKQRMAGLFEAGRGQVAEEEGEPLGVVFGSGQAQAFEDEDEFFKAMKDGLFWYDAAFEYGGSVKFNFLGANLKEALAGYFSEKGEKAALLSLGVTKGADQAFLPHFEPYVPSVEEKEGGLPLLLVPTEQLKLVTSSIGNAPYLTKLLEDITLKENYLVVEINPETAEALHLKEGDEAVLRTAKGKMTVRVHLFDGARPDVVYAPIGLGHQGFGYYLRGKGSNPLEIAEPVTDPLSGLSVWWGSRANLTKV